MSDSSTRIIPVVLLLLAISAFLVLFLYFGLQAIAAQQQEKADDEIESQVFSTTQSAESDEGSDFTTASSE